MIFDPMGDPKDPWTYARAEGRNHITAKDNEKAYAAGASAEQVYRLRLDVPLHASAATPSPNVRPFTPIEISPGAILVKRTHAEVKLRHDDIIRLW
jgi:hypothetical protein